MSWIIKMAILFEGLAFVTVIAALVYLIVKRVEKEKTEDFEKRDN